MSIIRGGIGTAAVRYGRIVIGAVYHGLDIVWQSIRSCFGSGTWFNDKPWIDDEFWKNS